MSGDDRNIWDYIICNTCIVYFYLYVDIKYNLYILYLYVKRMAFLQQADFGQHWIPMPWVGSVLNSTSLLHNVIYIYQTNGSRMLARGPYRRKISSAALPNLLPAGCPQHFSQVWRSAGSEFQLVQWDILAVLETGKSMDINGLIQIPTIQRWESNPRKSKITHFGCVFWPKNESQPWPKVFCLTPAAFAQEAPVGQQPLPPDLQGHLGSCHVGACKPTGQLATQLPRFSPPSHSQAIRIVAVHNPEWGSSVTFLSLWPTFVSLYHAKQLT